MKAKILICILAVAAAPTVVLGGSFTYSLIQGKTVDEAFQILASQLDFMTVKVEEVSERQGEVEARQVEVEESLLETSEVIDEIVSQNDVLKQQLDEISEQAELDRECEQLKMSGNRRVSNQQPIDELYESLSQQHSVTFESAYAEHQDNGAKVLPEQEFRAQWESVYAWRTEWLDELKPYYEEYIAKCRS